VLDPVGCGATPYRTETSVALSKLTPTIIRGNASEIMSLAGAAGAGGKGVDSTASSDAAVDAAVALAGKTGAVVAVTGKTDYATDGKSLVAIDGGDEMMTLSTATGCSLSATTAAFATVREPLAAAVFGLAVFGAAGAEAASRVKGPGFMPQEICDALYRMDEALLKKRAAIHVKKR
jgi:hydroxyethylthiazole kinase